MAEKILIVDDTPANMSVLVDMLEPHGYTVSAAPNGVVGLNVAVKLLPDLVLLDVMMPELDGLETCRRLKANPRTTTAPVLFISARDDAASILEGFRAGGADYIVKPFQPEEVLARVQAHLRIAALTRQLQEQNTQLTRANEQLQREITRRRQTEEALSTADARLMQIADAEARKWGLERYVGASKPLLEILEAIRRLQAFPPANTPVPGGSGDPEGLATRGPLPEEKSPGIKSVPAETSRESSVPASEGFAELPLNLDKAETILMQRALAQTGGNVAKAARLLGINRTRIYRKFHEGNPPDAAGDSPA